MPTLVLDLTRMDLDLLGRQGIVRIRRDDAAEIAAAIDDVVAFATQSPSGPVYCGIATIEALAGPGLVPGELVVQLRKVQLYEGEPAPLFPPGRRIQWVDAPPPVAGGLEELAQSPLEAPTSHELTDISRLALRRYHERCAISGIAMPVGELGSLPSVIRPGAAGLSLSITNFIALWGPLGAAFGAGHFTIGVNYEVIANIDLIDQALRPHLQPGLRLRLPDQEEDWPSQDHLAWHRLCVFRR